jgi:fatty-acyl-CoA synthase
MNLMPDVWQTFDRGCRVFANRLATYFQGESLTYGELHDRAAGLAASLFHRYGVGAGDVIAVASLNRPEVLETYFAAARLGSALTVINTRLTAAETTDMLKLSGAKVVLCEPRFARNVEGSGLPLIALSDEPWPEDTTGPASYLTALRREPPAPLGNHESALDAPLLMVFTSGSTGRPKAIQLTQRNLVWDAIGQSYYLRLRPGDRQLLGTPMCWTGGIVLVTQAFLLNGLPIDILPAWTIDAAVEAISVRGCTVFGTMPLLVRQLLDVARQPDGPKLHLRTLVCGGGAHTSDFDNDVIGLLGVEDYLYIYGLTESTSAAMCTGSTEMTLRKELGIGFPAWYVDHRIVDEDFNDVAPGLAGQLLLRGPTITPGTTRCGLPGPEIRDGWMCTGDVVRADEDGCLFFVDRAKDMVKTGGLNVYAAEVEQSIVRAHGSIISDVAVVGVPSKQWGEAVVAAVELADDSTIDEAAFLAALRGMLADYKIPKRVIYGELARTSTGKINKPLLRQTLAREHHDL